MQPIEPTKHSGMIQPNVGEKTGFSKQKIQKIRGKQEQQSAVNISLSEYLSKPVLERVNKVLGNAELGKDKESVTLLDELSMQVTRKDVRDEMVTPLLVKLEALAEKKLKGKENQPPGVNKQV